jgi:TetR/AcrR family transcriptional repressor of nem operon
LCLKTYQKTSKEFLNKSICSSNCSISVLETIFKIGVSSDKNYLEKGCLFNSCASEMANQEPTIHSFLQNNQQQMITLFEDIVIDGQNKNLINTNKSANEYALYLLNAFQGLRISGILTNNEQQLENIVNTTLSILK